MGKSKVNYHTEYYINNQHLGIVDSIGFIPDAKDMRNEIAQNEKKEKMILKLQQKLHDKNKDNGENKL